MRSLALTLLGVVLAGCSSTAYQKPVASFKTSIDTLTAARSTFAATNGQGRPEAYLAVEDVLLNSGAPLQAETGCVDQANAALDAALAALAAGASLDSLYAPGGPMAAPAACSIDVQAVAPAPAKPAAAAAAFDQADADKEATQDEASCKARTAVVVPQPPSAEPVTATDATGKKQALVDKADDADALWKSIDGYAGGLADLSSADNSTSLTTAVSGAQGAIESAGKGLNSPAFDPAVELLFAVFDKAVEQERYEAIKTAVICANPLFIRWRSTLRDSLRYEQIAAFENDAALFHADVGHLKTTFNPGPCSGVPNLELSPGCATQRATDVIRDAGSSEELRFVAYEYLADRATRLEPRLKTAQGDAAAVVALSTADPAQAVDAFIAAHRALRKAVIDNTGQLAALESSLNALYTAADALDKALQPVKAAAAKSKGA